ncbi:hypothetical protein CI109_104666 [Kwoniella shandongensis]|uniref:Uncharacterized protein n=1 Tax=Kwoniella shandongensis TaxID=1734106 RepID=A0A5M6BY67_9TREE|nr:uncharacterized protein CI109_004832 [Kwoniella shandongensis]KAA5526832.1 hypothetical protein CI109_004832 [Kwoniella shandongensis]
MDANAYAHGRNNSIAKSLDAFNIDIEAVADSDTDNTYSPSPSASDSTSSTPDRSPSPTFVSKPPPAHRRFLDHLSTSIDSSATSPIAIYSCFLTGLTAAPSFAACFVWCGFQTGNAAQLGLAIARTWTPGADDGFQKMDQQALVSLLCFLVGASLGQIGNRVGGRKRSWLVGATLGMMVLMMGAAVAALVSGESGVASGRGDPSWVTPKGMLALAFLSAAMGLQGAVGSKLGSPLGCTVPLTSTWVDIFNDPFLFALKPIRTRDVRLLGAFALIFGACVARSILVLIGSPGTIGVVIGFRAIQCVWWFYLPDEPYREERSSEMQVERKDNEKAGQR